MLTYTHIECVIQEMFCVMIIYHVAINDSKLQNHISYSFPSSFPTSLPTSLPLYLTPTLPKPIPSLPKTIPPKAFSLLFLPSLPFSFCPPVSVFSHLPYLPPPPSLSLSLSGRSVVSYGTFSYISTHIWNHM